VYKKVVVKPDKIELREKILFAFDRAEIEPESRPLLDEVTQALKDNKGFRVMIEGNTDSTGPKEHNQTLSEERARAVLTYLLQHGIAEGRLAYRGFGSSEPTETNTTVAGREANRRVEFIVQLKIVDRSAK
jgi:OOP family OmpA-OmpF porin